MVLVIFKMHYYDIQQYKVSIHLARFKLHPYYFDLASITDAKML